MSTQVIPHSFLHLYPPFETEKIMICTMSRPSFLFDFTREDEEFRIIPLSFCRPGDRLFENNSIYSALRNISSNDVELHEIAIGERQPGDQNKRADNLSPIHDLSIVHLVGNHNFNHEDGTVFYEPGMYRIYVSTKSGHFHCSLPDHSAPTLVPFGVTDNGKKLKERISDLSGIPGYEMELEFRKGRGNDNEWQEFEDHRTVSYYGLKKRDQLRVVRHNISRSRFVLVEKSTSLSKYKAKEDNENRNLIIQPPNDGKLLFTSSNEIIRVPQSALVDVPQYRTLVPGLNLVGICGNNRCRLHDKEQLFRYGYGDHLYSETPSQHPVSCSACNGGISRKTALILTDCTFKYTAILGMSLVRYYHVSNSDIKITQERVRSKGWNEVSEDVFLKFSYNVDNEDVLRLFVYPRWMKEKFEKRERDWKEDCEFCSLCTKKLSEEEEEDDEHHQQKEEEEEMVKKKIPLVVIPKCEHVFHRRCIDTWKENHLESNDFCPRCQVGVVFKKRLRKRQRERLFNSFGEFLIISIAVIVTVLIFLNNKYDI